MPPGPDRIADTTLQRALGDWLWGGLGIGTATASAGFAAYMLVVGPSGLAHRPSPDFASFATLTRASLRGGEAAQMLHGPSDRPRDGSQDSASSAAASAGPVDFDPTGTVAEAKDERKIEPNMRQQVQGGAAALPGFVLRDVFDGKALVESRTALSLVAPGSALVGGGEVLSIERRGESWVVATTRGIISTPAHDPPRDEPRNEGGDRH